MAYKLADRRLRIQKDTCISLTLEKMKGGPENANNEWKMIIQEKRGLANVNTYPITND